MVHQYKLGGYNIVLDICSGGVHVVDDIAYDIIAMYEGADRASVIKDVSNKYANDNIFTHQDLSPVFSIHAGHALSPGGKKHPFFEPNSFHGEKWRTHFGSPYFLSVFSYFHRQKLLHTVIYSIIT